MRTWPSVLVRLFFGLSDVVCNLLVRFIHIEVITLLLSLYYGHFICMFHEPDLQCGQIATQYATNSLETFLVSTSFWPIASWGYLIFHWSWAWEKLVFCIPGVRRCTNWHRPDATFIRFCGTAYRRASTLLKFRSIRAVLAPRHFWVMCDNCLTMMSYTQMAIV